MASRPLPWAAAAAPPHHHPCRSLSRLASVHTSGALKVTWHPGAPFWRAPSHGVGLSALAFAPASFSAVLPFGLLRGSLCSPWWRLRRCTTLRAPHPSVVAAVVRRGCSATQLQGGEGACAFACPPLRALTTPLASQTTFCLLPTPQERSRLAVVPYQWGVSRSRKLDI
ncbi:hypothetical protein ES703_114652 [subsurface metagenome]